MALATPEQTIETLLKEIEGLKEARSERDQAWNKGYNQGRSIGINEAAQVDAGYDAQWTPGDALAAKKTAILGLHNSSATVVYVKRGILTEARMVFEDLMDPESGCRLNAYALKNVRTIHDKIANLTSP